MSVDYKATPIHPHSADIFDGLVTLVWDRELPPGYENEAAILALAKLLWGLKKPYSFYCFAKVMDDPIGKTLMAIIREALAEDIFWAFDPVRAASIPIGQFYAFYRSLMSGDGTTEEFGQCVAARLTVIVNYYDGPEEAWWLCKAVKSVAGRSFSLS